MFAENPYLTTVLWVIVTVAAALIIERILTRWLRRVMKSKEIPPEIGNGLVLTERIIILVGVTIALLHVGGFPAETIISFSAIGGAAVGFASTRTIGNIIAGIFLFATRPFRVGDYVRIDGIEGVVQEITLNYAKILTISGNIVSVSAQRILDRDIIDYRFVEGEESNIYRYGFDLAFDHTLSVGELEKALDSVLGKYAGQMPRKPDYEVLGITAFARNYRIYIYVEDARDIFKFYPKITREIIQAWEEAKLQAAQVK
ncbi:MAG: mechanosensitive ion channel family protein [Leptospiraceae bacterium]|nr:mechanosensitive ion channel family protein [Leptospiraceae bacterium]